MKIWILWLVLIAAFLVGAGAFMTQMPGQSATGALPAATPEEEALADDLEEHLDVLAHTILNRSSSNLEGTQQTVEYLESRLSRAGYEVRQHTFEARRGMAINLEATKSGTTRKSDYVLVAAHYDCEPKSTGADANATGCAALLELAKILSDTPSERSFRFVLLASGSESHAGDEHSGAAAYARELRKRGEKVVLGFVLDGLGYYKDGAGTQSVPFPFNFAYPDTANFVLFAGDTSARDLLRESILNFRANTRFPSEGVTVPGFFPGFASTNCAAFASAGWKCILVTDTGRLRFPGADTATDLPAVIDYNRFARVTLGLSRVMSSMAKSASLL